MPGVIEVEDRETLATEFETTARASRRPAFDYLRALVIVLVLWHHSILAYTTFAALNPANPVQTFSPVVDRQRWPWFDLMAGFNDIFLMALLFFVSGLFVDRSLKHSGAGAYIRRRFLRLGVPFLVALPLLVPLAYYPAQLTVELVHGGATSYPEFWMRMVSRGFETAGPLWFLWLLLVFDGLAALAYRTGMLRAWTAPAPPRSGLWRPLTFAAALIGISAAAYLPMVLIFGPLEWIGVGPFMAQASRVLFYLVYFAAGIAAGASGLTDSVLGADAPLARRWWAWLTAGLVFFVGLVGLVVAGTPRPVTGALMFTITCATLVLASLALALRFVRRRLTILDSLAENAYGMYIVHYVVVTWAQYWLLGWEQNAITKALFVFTATLFLSWGLTAVARRFRFGLP